jgi:ubiquinone/menaquinone biosynthesis C-methylase UbiE
MSGDPIATTFDRWVASGAADALETSHRGALLELLAAHPVRAGQRVLDLGCGTGWATRLFGQAAPGSQGVGVDASPRMVERAEELTPWTVRARYEVARFEALPFADAHFDRVVSMEALYYAPDLDRALAEARRVLRPGGVLDVLVDCYTERPDTAGWADAVGLALQRLSQSEWRSRLEDIGFHEVAAARLVDPRGPGDPTAFRPDRWYPDWDARVRAHAEGTLWLRGQKG